MEHKAKITVYLTPDELARLDKLVCHIKHDLHVKVDRSRIVREALALVRQAGKKSAAITRMTPPEDAA